MIFTSTEAIKRLKGKAMALTKVSYSMIDGTFINVLDFGAVGDGVADDTTAIQAAFTFAVANTTSGATTSGALTTSFSGNSPRVFFPKGTYKITAKITIGSYLEVLGDSAIIKQETATQDIFECEAYQLLIDGMQFVGGRHQVNFYNANINSTMVKITNCQFFLSRSYAIKTAATGGVWTHLSCDLSIEKCRFITCNKVLDNCCDSAVIENCWIQPTNTNMDVSAAIINNKGTSVVDPDAWTRLHIKDSFLIPDIGTFGVDQPTGIRWVDNYGSFTATHSRFGGEFGGMPIVYHLGAPNTTFPWITTEVMLTECALFVGPDARTDACVVAISGEIPNRVVVRNCTGPVGRPIIFNASSTNIPNYMAAFESASSKKAYNYFKYDIQDVITDIPSYSPVRSFIPNDLYRFVIKAKQTQVSRSPTAQSIPTGLSTGTKVSFDTVVFDNIGAWVSGTPTRLFMPVGCSKARIDVYAAMDVDGAAKTIKYAIVNDGGTIEAQNTELRGVNPSSDSVTVSAVVQGASGANYWEIEIDHNAVGALDLVGCVATITPLDFVG